MKLTGQEVYWCRDHQDAKELLSLATELGMEWSDGGVYANDPRWYDYQSHTCYNLVSGEHAPKEVYELMGMKIVDVGKKLDEKYS
jgi:hypothetical protein